MPMKTDGKMWELDLASWQRRSLKAADLQEQTAGGGDGNEEEGAEEGEVQVRQEEEMG